MENVDITEMSWADLKSMFYDNIKEQKEIREAELRILEEDRRKREEDKLKWETSLQEDRQKWAKWEESQEKSRKEDAEKWAEWKESQEKSRKEDAEKWAEWKEAQEKSRQEDAEKWAKWEKELSIVHKKLGGIDNNLGQHAEQFFQESLSRSLRFGGETYDKMLANVKAAGKNTPIEFDILLVNGKSVAIIEAKNSIHSEFIKDLAQDRLAKFRLYFNEYENHKVYLGVAGFSIGKGVPDEAKKYGVGIIRQVGESIEIDDINLKAY